MGNSQIELKLIMAYLDTSFLSEDDVIKLLQIPIKKHSIKRVLQKMKDKYFEDMEKSNDVYVEDYAIMIHDKVVEILVK